MEKYVGSCPGGQWFDSRGLQIRAQASVDRDCKNLLGSKQGDSRARILGGAGADKTQHIQKSHPDFGSTSVQPTYLLLTSKIFLVVSPKMEFVWEISFGGAPHALRSPPPGGF